MSATQSKSDTTPIPPRRRNNKREREIDSIITSVGKRLTEARTEDSHDIFGRNIANKLRNLPNDQRIYLEKIINDAVFEAELGNLCRNCYVYVPTPRQVSSNVATYGNSTSVPMYVPSYNAGNLSEMAFSTPSHHTITMSNNGACQNINLDVSTEDNISGFIKNYKPS